MYVFTCSMYSVVELLYKYENVKLQMIYILHLNSCVSITENIGLVVDAGTRRVNRFPSKFSI